MTATAQPAVTSRSSGWFALRTLVRTRLLAALAVVAVFGAGAVSAAATVPRSSARVWPKPWAARFVMPNSGAIVTDGSVPAVVQLAPGVDQPRISQRQHPSHHRHPLQRERRSRLDQLNLRRQRAVIA
jgi:hypothetical protein